MNSEVITNIAAYLFARLQDLKPLRERLLTQCKAWSLKGTILLSPEGINLFVAGPGESVDLLVNELREIPGLEKLTPKYSESAHQPFNRMLVRLKKEIIAFGMDSIQPGDYTSTKLSAHTLKQWLDEGRPVTLLDTRNDYEVKLGTFKGAVIPGIKNFREFPDAVRKMPEDMKSQPIVMFCTGGIRCEKAGPFMEQEGFSEIYQLDGGILKYFEECGSAHYDGECFVFDQRVGVDPSLRETTSALCYVCQTPLSTEDQEDFRYVPNVSCPYCFKSDDEKRALEKAQRIETIRRITSPLPGSAPYENLRPLNIPARVEGVSLLEALGGMFPHVPRPDWVRLCEDDMFLDADGHPVAGGKIVRAGERYFRRMPGTVEPEVNADIRIVHEDEALVVLHKPAPLPMHPSGRFNRNTLQYILDEAYAPQKLRPVHRLDANTTGIVVYARTRHFAKLLQHQITSDGGLERVYLARIQGHPSDDSFSCDAPILDEPDKMGSRTVAETGGQTAHTDFVVKERRGDGSALIEARPKTGRTNQIRVHLWHLGFPIVSDGTYLPDGKLGDTQSLSPDSPPMCLHAWRLSFQHPLTGAEMVFEADAPAWATSNV